MWGRATIAWEVQIDVFYVKKKTLKKGKGGSIINIGSIYGIVSPDQKIYNKGRKIENQKNVLYTITKSSLVGLTKHLAVIFAKDKIRVNCTCFGGVKNKQNKNKAVRRMFIAFSMEFVWQVDLEQMNWRTSE